MKRYSVQLAHIGLMLFIVTLAIVDKIQQPVGGVSEMFCKRVEKPCYTFEYEVNK